MKKMIELQNHKKKQGYWYENMEDVSDGYHTFKELYEFRLLYNAAFFKALNDDISDYGVHKSQRHSDGEKCFGGGWFIVMAQLPSGQISNHYELKDWELFDIPVRNKAAEFDGHTAQNVALRLKNYLKGKPHDAA